MSKRWLIGLALVFTCVAWVPSARAQDGAVTERSGLQLALAMGFSLNPPPVCRNCVTYHGVGLGFEVDVGRALRSDLVLSLSTGASVMLFADDTNGFVNIYDLGLARWWGRGWGRLGAGPMASVMTSKDYGDMYDGVSSRKKWGPGASLTAGYDVGAGRPLVDLRARLVVVKVADALVSTVLLLGGVGWH